MQRSQKAHPSARSAINKRKIKQNNKRTKPRLGSTSVDYLCLPEDRSNFCWDCGRNGHTRFTCDKERIMFCSRCGRIGILSNECSCSPKHQLSKRLETGVTEKGIQVSVHTRSVGTQYSPPESPERDHWDNLYQYDLRHRLRNRHRSPPRSLPRSKDLSPLESRPRYRDRSSPESLPKKRDRWDEPYCYDRHRSPRSPDEDKHLRLEFPPKMRDELDEPHRRWDQDLRDESQYHDQRDKSHLYNQPRSPQDLVTQGVPAEFSLQERDRYRDQDRHPQDFIVSQYLPRKPSPGRDQEDESPYYKRPDLDVEIQWSPPESQPERGHMDEPHYYDLFRPPQDPDVKTQSLPLESLLRRGQSEKSHLYERLGYPSDLVMEGQYSPLESLLKKKDHYEQNRQSQDPQYSPSKSRSKIRDQLERHHLQDRLDEPRQDEHLQNLIVGNQGLPRESSPNRNLWDKPFHHDHLQGPHERIHYSPTKTPLKDNRWEKPHLLEKNRERKHLSPEPFPQKKSHWDEPSDHLDRYRRSRSPNVVAQRLPPKSSSKNIKDEWDKPQHYDQYRYPQSSIVDFLSKKRDQGEKHHHYNEHRRSRSPILSIRGASSKSSPRKVDRYEPGSHDRRRSQELFLPW